MDILMDMYLNCRSSPVNISLWARVFDGDLSLFQEGQDTGDPARVVDVLRKLLGRGPPPPLPPHYQ